MEKDEILARSRKNGPDEREQKIFLEAYNFSASVCILLWDPPTSWFIVFN